MSLIFLMELLTEDVLSEFQDSLKKMALVILKIEDHLSTAIHIQSLTSLSELLYLTKMIKDVGSRPSPRAAFGYGQTANVGFIFGGRCASGVQTLDDKTIFIVSILRPGHGHL